MKKFIRSLIIASAFAAGTGAIVVSAPAIAEAQTKEQTKGDPKTKTVDPKVDPKGTKPVDPKPAVKGSVVIKPGKDGKFRFFVRDEDDKTLMQSSTGYATEEEAMKMLDAAKAILAGAKVTKEKADSK